MRPKRYKIYTLALGECDDGVTGKPYEIFFFFLLFEYITDDAEDFFLDGKKMEGGFGGRVDMLTCPTDREFEAPSSTFNRPIYPWPGPLFSIDNRAF